MDEALAALDAAAVPAGRIYTVADIAADPHYRARDMICEQRTGRRRDARRAGHRAQAVAHARRRRSAAPRLGQDTDAVLREVGLSGEQIALLRAKGVIG